MVPVTMKVDLQNGISSKMLLFRKLEFQPLCVLQKHTLKHTLYKQIHLDLILNCLGIARTIISFFPCLFI